MKIKGIKRVAASERRQMSSGCGSAGNNGLDKPPC
jgi:hypothetical protein